jgi:phosphoserine phosphatase RsbU/P
LASKSKVLWVSRKRPPANVRQALRGRWRLAQWRPEKPLGDELTAASVALVHTNGHPDSPRLLGRVLAELDRTASVAVFLLPPPEVSKLPWQVLSRRHGRFLCVRQDAPHEELAAKLSAAAALQPAFGDLREELLAARAGRPEAAEADQSLTQELHLAARLQRDFLPRRLPEVGPVRFAAIYQPLGWVSGDIYDVARLDETHLGFYVADAVGHGLPAALLTMFIKKALQTKRIMGSAYEIVPPDVSLAELNRDICHQAIASCPFCTAIYCVLDVQNMRLTYSRAGHPEAILLRAGGGAERLAAPGTLLGIFPDETYESRQVTLAPGDRLVLYTDGVESALCGPAAPPDMLEKTLIQWASLPREEFVLRLSERLTGPDASHVNDDITVIVAEVSR